MKRCLLLAVVGLFSSLTLVPAQEAATIKAPLEVLDGLSRDVLKDLRSGSSKMSAAAGEASKKAAESEGKTASFKITIGNIDDVIGQIRSNKGFYYVPQARAWITEYPREGLSKAKAVYGAQTTVFAGLEAGVMALYQKCPHLGCRVPNCASSQWFECPCHGSQYNRVGEKKGGPAPRGMDHFGVSVANGILVVDTGTVFGGPPIGTNTTGQEAEGPHCVGGGH
jgi:Rieske Fe-S protein